MSITTALTRNVTRAVLGTDHFLLRMPAAAVGDESVFLTFDDGPDTELTPRILDDLASVNAKATFFVLGPKLAGNEHLVQRILTEGHAIGSHGWGHHRATELSAAEWLEDARRGIVALEEATGRDCHLFRPAYGELTPRTLRGLLDLKQRIVLWSDDVRDFLLSSHEEFRGWFLSNAPQSGSIVLMHDNQANTAACLKEGLAVWSGTRFDKLVPGNHQVDS